jgi:fumarate hydratase subunit beta
MMGEKGREPALEGGEKRVTLPLSRQARQELRAGDRLLLTGRMITARDQAHRRIAAALARGEEPPVPLAGETVFYAGPTPPPRGKPAGSVGPTTASRMDPYTPELAARGVAAFIGKGPRSDEVRRSLREQGAVYLVAVGGAAALLGSRVRSIRVIAYPELGAEAVYELEVENFPVVGAGDHHRRAGVFRPTGNVGAGGF